MIRMKTQLGLIGISQEYFNEVIGNAVSHCYGVAGMGNGAARREWRAAVGRKKNAWNQGVRVYRDGNGILVDLHITIRYGFDISAIVRATVSRVHYAVEKATGLQVKKVNVFVDGLLREDELQGQSA